MAETIGIRRYEFVEFYVGSAKMAAYWYARALGMAVTGYSGPETGVRDRCSYYLTLGELKFVLTSPLGPAGHEVQSFLDRHGDGVRRWALEVDDVAAAFARATANGAVPSKKLSRLEDANGVVDEAAIGLYDDTEIVLVNRDRYRGILRPGFGPPVQRIETSAEKTGLLAVDHIVGNVRQNEMDRWAEYFNRALGFETFVDFKPGDIGTQYSALLSKVVRSEGGKIKNPINEPYDGLKRSQIEEYLEHYQGSGVQHIAVATRDIVKSIAALRHNGVEFLSAPATYYDALRRRKDLAITEDLADLERMGILCDIEGQGYLLQLFTKPIGDRPTFFFEFIQRRNGSTGFGKGNFQALFEAIEADQKLRGNLDR